MSHAGTAISPRPATPARSGRRPWGLAGWIGCVAGALGGWAGALEGVAQPQSAPPAAAAPALVEIPPVLLTDGHQQRCRVGVGATFPEMTLADLDGKTTSVRSVAGRRGTVVLLWTPDRWMARAALHDLTRDFKQLAADGAFGVVGVAVGQPVGAVRAALTETGAAFPQLLDPDGQAFALVGDAHLPRIYVLDAQGRIVWFDIEYGEATRRELRQTLTVLAR